MRNQISIVVAAGMCHKLLSLNRRLVLAGKKYWLPLLWVKIRCSPPSLPCLTTAKDRWQPLPRRMQQPVDCESVRHRSLGRDDAVNDIKQLIDPKWLEEHKIDARVAGFDDRVPRVVAEACHQNERHSFEQFV